MEYLKYSVQNLKLFILNHRAMFMMMFLFEIIAVVCLLFSYGLFFNARETSGELEDEQRTFVYDFCAADENGGYDYSTALTEMDAKADELIEFLGEDFDSITLYMMVTDENGNEHSASAYGYLSGESERFENADFSVSDNWCAVSDSVSSLVSDGKIVINGAEFNVLETGDFFSDIIMPLRSVTSDFECASMTFKLNSQPSREEIDSIDSKCAEIFGVTSTEQPEASSLLEAQINNMFYLYSVIIIVIFILNLSLYFKYTFQTRKNQMYIFMLCGSESKQITLIFVLQTIFQLIAGFALGFALFHSCGIDLCQKIYPDFSEYYGQKIYLTVFALYLIISILIVFLITLPYVKSIVNIKERSAVK